MELAALEAKALGMIRKFLKVADCPRAHFSIQAEHHAAGRLAADGHVHEHLVGNVSHVLKVGEKFWFM